MISCLQYEHIKERDNDEKESVLKIGVVSTGIYFIQEGKLEVIAKDQDHPLLVYDAGSYFGDASFIFKIRNMYGYYFNKAKQDI